MGNQDQRNQWSIWSFDSFETMPVVVTTDHRNQWSISFERHGVSLFSDIFFEVEVVIVKVSILEYEIHDNNEC